MNSQTPVSVLRTLLRLLAVLTRFLALSAPLRRVPAIALAATAGVSQAGAAENNWPSWRGPAGNGHLNAEPGAFPTEWSGEDGGKNIAWQIPLPGPGNSSPIVWGDRVFLTVAVDQGKTRSLICFNRADGKELWKADINYPEEDATHKTNFFSSASPATDGQAIYAWHGNAGLFAYGFDGSEKWRRTDLGKYDHQWGPNASSPVLHGNTLFHAGPGSHVSLFALDKSSGKTLWQTHLPDAESETFKQFKGSWSTPLLLDNDGREELLPLPQRLASFDPATGKEIWTCTGMGDLCYTDVIVTDDQLVAMSGYRGPAMGIRLPGPTATGDITESHRTWLTEKNQQRIGSPILAGKHIYVLNEPGVIQCLEAATGEETWKARLSATSWSSANLVGSLLYFTDQTGSAYVVEPNPSELRFLETNRLAKREMSNATLAFSSGDIFLRTHENLYCIRRK